MKTLRSRAALVAALTLAGCGVLRPASRDHARDNARLTELASRDQADRAAPDNARRNDVERRDAERRREAGQILDAGKVRTAADHYHAALIFQHGSDSTAYGRAHRLAVEAERLGSPPARWLAVASLDRYLLSTGQPQRYATQFAETPAGLFLQRLDSTAVTDAERHRVGARTLAETRAFLARANGTPSGSLAPPPDRPEHAPTVNLIGGADALARLVVYPAAARAARVEGLVRVQLVVQADGTVGEAFVVDGLGLELDEEALRVVRAARFVNHVGEPTEIRLAVPFTLGGS